MPPRVQISDAVSNTTPRDTISKPSEINSLAAAIAGEATGEVPKTPPPPKKNRAAVALGRKGGKKGGPARAKALTAEQRSEIAKKAAEARWSQEKKP
jgi:hypothetical protein